MLKRFQPQVAWLTGLLLLSLLLAACGGAAEPASPDQAAPAQGQETAARTDDCTVDTSCGPAQTEEAANSAEPAALSSPEAAATTEIATEAPVTAESIEIATTTEAAVAPGEETTTQAACQSVDIPNNTLIAAVSEQDWSKGPADAPVTLIEYGDFQ